MDKMEKLRRFESYFSILRARGIIKTQGDLATLIGVSNKSISAAKNGNETYLTESLLSKIDAAVKLIDEGNTIPFIARYRKEVTGGLSDEQLRTLGDRLNYLRDKTIKTLYQPFIYSVFIRNG